MPGPRAAKLLGAVIGITVGCLLGMFPLLLFDTKLPSDTKRPPDTKRSHDTKRDGEGQMAAGA
jgi:aspartyl/asparaginyl beta-hydroxylase (cupin superfamily)